MADTTTGALGSDPSNASSPETFTLVEPPLSSGANTPTDSTSNISTTKDDGPRIIDAEGDLILVVVPKNGQATVSYKVNSVLVCKASARWKLLFAQRFQSHESVGQQMLIEEDKVKMLEMALKIAHLQFDGVPLYLKFSELVEVAELLHRHQLCGLLHEYMASWCKPFIPNILEPGYEMWILIAHELGWQKIFQTVARDVYTAMHVSEGKYWIGTINLSESSLPKRILGELEYITMPS